MIVDTHVHFSKISSFIHCSEYESKVDYSYNGYINECKKNNIAKSVCMGVTETSSEVFPARDTKSPMLADLDSRLPDNMYICPGINPHTLTDESLNELKQLIKNNKKIVGVKIYAGYYHTDIYDKIFEPVYCLAEEHGLTVAIHSGDTYSDRGLLTFSHPLHVDRVAVAHRDLNIVICHMGNPWVIDASEVAYKNRNVYLDLSGLYCGREAIKAVMSNHLQLERYIQAIQLLDNYKKIMFGTDWPLAPMDIYIDFCKKLIPYSEHEDVFYNNACKVYKLF